MTAAPSGPKKPAQFYGPAPKSNALLKPSETIYLSERLTEKISDHFVELVFFKYRGRMAGIGDYPQIRIFDGLGYKQGMLWQNHIMITTDH